MAQTGSFGDIIFEVSAELVKTWENLSSKRKASFATHELAGGRAKLEFTGLELQDLNFDVRLDARSVSPYRESNKLQAALEDGEPRVLILGGRPRGEFVLQDITEQETHADAHGRTMISRLKLKFKEYN